MRLWKVSLCLCEMMMMMMRVYFIFDVMGVIDVESSDTLTHHGCMNIIIYAY